MGRRPHSLGAFAQPAEIQISPIAFQILQRNTPPPSARYLRSKQIFPGHSTVDCPRVDYFCEIPTSSRYLTIEARLFAFAERSVFGASVGLYIVVVGVFVVRTRRQDEGELAAKGIDKQINKLAGQGGVKANVREREREIEESE